MVLHVVHMHVFLVPLYVLAEGCHSSDHCLFGRAMCVTCVLPHFFIFYLSRKTVAVEVTILKILRKKIVEVMATTLSLVEVYLFIYLLI